MVLFRPPFYFVFDISNLLSYIQNNFSYELARPIMGTIFLVYIYIRFSIEQTSESVSLASLAHQLPTRASEQGNVIGSVRLYISESTVVLSM